MIPAEPMASAFRTRTTGREPVLSPQGPLVAGGRAEQLEQLIQASYREGAQRIVVDLRDVTLLDSAGIRALVRGHTSAQRLGREFSIVAPSPAVREMLGQYRLDRVFSISASVASARAHPVPWRRLATAAAVTVGGLSLVAAGYWWPQALAPGGPEVLPGAGVATFPASGSPIFELAKLGVAAVVGMLVTTVQRSYRGDGPPNPTLEQAQVLLCVAGALMMIIIGGSLARAFGIAGAAAIIRFRTPVEDARDITVLFLLMGLGMAAGLGGFAVAGLGTLFLCAMFPVLNLFSAPKPRQMLVEIVARGTDFPLNHVQTVFALNRIVFEPRELEQGDEATVRYLTVLGPDDSIEDLSQQLMDGGRAGIRNVSWSPAKRG